MITLARDFGFGREFASEQELKDALKKYKPTVDANTFSNAWAAAAEAVRATKPAEAYERFATPMDGLRLGAPEGEA